MGDGSVKTEIGAGDRSIYHHGAMSVQEFMGLLGVDKECRCLESQHFE